MVDLPRYETLLVERTDGITTLTLNRPDKKNAMSPTLAAEALDALRTLEFDPETKVLVITGAGDTFCAGMDLKEYFLEHGNDPDKRDSNRKVATEWTDRLLRMYAKPTICMINGDCYGGAFQIVASCDIAIASETARFALSEVNFGYLPGGMVAKVIQTLMPYRDAVYYAMTAERFDAKQAAAIRFINEAVPAASLKDRVGALARKLAGLDPEALRLTKEAVKQVADLSYEEASWFLMAKSNDLQWRHHLRGQAGNAGIQKFLDKEYKPSESSFTDTERGPKR